MVQIKATAAALIAVTVIAPAVASSFYADDSLVTREDFDEYNDVLARDYDYELEERQFDDSDLYERDPFLFKQWRENRKLGEKMRKDQKMKNTYGISPDAPADAETREFDNSELYEREPMLGWKHLQKWRNDAKAGKAMRHQLAAQGGGQPSDDGSASVDGREFDEVYEREFEDSDLYERDPFFFKQWRDNRKLGEKMRKDQKMKNTYGISPDAPVDAETREFDDSELYEREPMLGWKHFQKWRNDAKAGKAMRHQQAAQGGGQPSDDGSASVDGREFDEVYEREFEDLEVRNPWGNKLRKVFTPAPSGSDSDLPGRSFDDEMEVEARAPEAEYEDILQRYFDDLYEREFAAQDAAELVQREPSPQPFFEWLKKLFGKHDKKTDTKKTDAKKTATTITDAKATDSKAAADTKTQPDVSPDASVDAREYMEIDELD